MSELSSEQSSKPTESLIVEKIPTIEDYYQLLLREESRPPDPNENIYTGTITHDDPEYQRLIDVGATDEQIKKRSIPRHILLEAGFIFNNQPLFPIEKPLINTSIGDTNYGDRKLLTDTELAEILTYQRQHPTEFGSHDIKSDEFRQNMLSFLLTIEPNLPLFIEDKVNFYRICMGSIDKPYTTHERAAEYNKDKRQIKIDQIYKKLVILHHNSFATSTNPYIQEEQFIESNLSSDVMPWQSKGVAEKIKRFNITSRGREVMFIDSRKTKLNGMASPFLDSGFHFPQSIGNPDATVATPEGKMFRVNMLVLHLASRGLSEMGDGKKQDGEQDYSIGNFITHLTTTDKSTQTQWQDTEEALFKLKMDFDEEKLMRQVQAKLKELAAQWASSDQAPPEAKELLTQIQNMETDTTFLDKFFSFFKSKRKNIS